MAKKLYLVFLSFTFSLLGTYAQLTDKKIILDSIIQHYRSYDDEKILQGSLAKQIENAPKEDKVIWEMVYKTILAELYSTKKDSLNRQSEELFAEAVRLADKSNKTGLLIWVNTQYGFYYYRYGKYVDALPFFLRTSRKLEIFPTERIPEAADVLKKNAIFFGTINNNDRAITLLQEAMGLVPKTSPDHLTILHAIGSHHLKNGDLETAEKYFNLTKEAALEIGDEMSYAKMLGELALIQKKQNNLPEAERLLLQNIEISHKNGDSRNALYAQIQLGKLYLEHGEIEKASDVIGQANLYASTKDYLKGFEQEIAILQLQIAQLRGDDQEELAVRRKLDDINQFVAVSDGQKEADKANWETQRESIRSNLETAQAKLEKSLVVRQTWTAVSILLLTIAILTYTSYQRRLKLQTALFEGKILTFQYEKLHAEKQLNTANKSLSSFQVYLEEKNKQIDKLEKEIRKINARSDSKYKEQKGTLELILNSHLMTDENWYMFKNSFISEKKSFYENLMKNLPELTESNLRIILLQKIGLSNLETAHILGITLDAVKKSKQRMRKKYDRKFDETLGQ